MTTSKAFPLEYFAVYIFDPLFYFTYEHVVYNIVFTEATY